MAQLGSENNPLRVAIVGSGPSGFYAAESLIKSDIDVKVDMLERLPSPYGLVRSGVAPDHPKLKQATGQTETQSVKRQDLQLSVTIVVIIFTSPKVVMALCKKSY